MLSPPAMMRSKPCAKRCGFRPIISLCASTSAKAPRNRSLNTGSCSSVKVEKPRMSPKSSARTTRPGRVPADLASEGIPYTIGRYSFLGRLDRDPATADSVTGVWAHVPLGSGRVQRRRFPMNLDIFDFH